MSTNPRRDELKAMSQGLSTLKQQGAIETINEGLVKIYHDNGFKDLKSLRGWNKEGRMVKKGEKALLLWGQPTHRKQEQTATAPGTSPEQEDEYSFFPVAYVFDVTQTIEKA